jgi:hypothetical protein
MDVVDLTFAREGGRQLCPAGTGLIDRHDLSAQESANLFRFRRRCAHGRLWQDYFPANRGGLNHFPSREIGSSSFFGSGRLLSVVFEHAHDLVLPLIDCGLAQHHATTSQRRWNGVWSIS